ncbi:hypothetical protein ECDEC1E_5317 [Escherichia coli DEC1E]|nr:hypothetical protein ECDEC1E_5317 [Escherichia coli DEC1E]
MTTDDDHDDDDSPSAVTDEHYHQGLCLRVGENPRPVTRG